MKLTGFSFYQSIHIQTLFCLGIWSFPHDLLKTMMSLEFFIIEQDTQSPYVNTYEIVFKCYMLRMNS